ncbi:hypothetical protein GUITHDRAFT_99541 [Guillardia theta CCMP2712]|uniref:Uncharacterized protein n=1 Tax=Guillardia theta (strain CCMP2712) TaxID=905079 RepID=L1K361_GUITC|nr:hypothetical protein GUITHDRAFT_99541 [Guillardia theta CCMP2712]EKX54890.1 hypothetical protein GUITHDRAFT_99541 [Guillardia theta CCMP2712]|eukprot:XP_005841870.1 hypothetical protein GUITHDRAFT_99541 [Guillardia theta CCMP2712]
MARISVPVLLLALLASALVPSEAASAIHPQSRNIPNVQGGFVDQNERVEWRSWRMHVTDDRTEVLRLRGLLSQAEKDLENLNEELMDARQAQDRANLALQDKDKKIEQLRDMLQTERNALVALPFAVLTFELTLSCLQALAKLKDMNEDEDKDRWIDELQREVASLRNKLVESQESAKIQEESIAKRKLDLESQFSDRVHEEAEKMAKELVEDLKASFETNHVISLASEREAKERQRLRAETSENKVMALENQIGDLRQVIEDMNNTIVAQERKLEAAAKRLEEDEESDWLRDGAFGGESPRRSKKDLERVIENLKQSLVKEQADSIRTTSKLREEIGKLRGRLSEMKIAGVNSEDSSFAHQVEDVVSMSRNAEIPGRFEWGMRGEERGKRQLESKEALCVDLALNPSKASDRLALMKQEEESYVEAMLGDMRRLRDEISCLVGESTCMRLGLRQLSSNRCCDYGGCKPSGFGYQPGFAPSYPTTYPHSYPLAEGYVDLRSTTIPLRQEAASADAQQSSQDKEPQRRPDKDVELKQAPSKEKRGTSFLSCFGL